MEYLVKLQEPIAELCGAHGCVIATASGQLLLLVAILGAVVVGVAILRAVLAEPHSSSGPCKTVAERLERSARVVTPRIDPAQAQVLAIRKEAQKKADQAVKQALEDIEHIIKTEVDV